MYVDVHAHLDHVRYEKDLDKVIKNCRKNDVTVVLLRSAKHRNQVNVVWVESFMVPVTVTPACEENEQANDDENDRP